MRSVFFILVLTIAFFVVKLVFCQDKKSMRQTSWRETIGTLDPHGYSHGTIHYVVDGKEYSTDFVMRSQYNVLGEKFTMRYNVNNPEEARVDYWNPIFMPGEQTEFFSGTILKVHKKSIWDPTPFVEFTVNINGMTLERFVYLPSDYQKLYPNLQKGQHYAVEFLTANGPTRIVLHLNKPLKDTVNAK